MKKLFLFAFAFSLITATNAQYLLVEKYEPKDILENGQTNSLKIPFSKYTLDNGLTLIISEDHTNPLVNVNVTYKVGSVNDYADRTGMAYMIYSLMDNGSKHLHNGDYKKIINKYGGKTYSTITRDKTSFSATVPNNLLSTVLWMESDRQAYFLDSLTKEKFDKAKLDIIAMIYDSLYHQPYGLTDILAIKNLYPYAHPYTWPEFGVMDHFQYYQLPDLKKYFLDWYGTNNTIITITGDVVTADVVEQVNKYFGTLTKAPQSQAYVDDIVNRIMLGAATESNAPRYISYKIDISNPLLKIVFNTVPRYNTDEKSLNVIAAILGQGNNSVLYNEFIKSGYAIYVNAQHKTYRYFGEFTIDIMAMPDTSLEVIAKRFDKLLNEIVLNKSLNPGMTSNRLPGSQPPSVILPPNMPPQINMPQQPNMQVQGYVPPQPYIVQTPEQIFLNESQSGDAIFKTVSSLKTQELWSLETLQNKGSALSERELISGKPAEVSPSLLEYDKLNPQTFFELFNRYMLNNSKLYVSYTSKDKGKLIAAPDNIKEMELQSILTPTKDSDLVYRFPAKEINKKQPKIKDIAVNQNIDVKLETTPYGMKVGLVQSKDFPFVTINLRMNVSVLNKLLPTLDVSKLISWLYTDWFETQGNDNPLKAATLTGSLIQFKPEKEFVNISVVCPREHVMMIKEALVQMMYRPEYGTTPINPQFTSIAENLSTAGDFKKADNDDVVQYLSTDPSETLSNNDSASKTSITKKQVRTAFEKLFTPKYLSASIYGDIDEGMYRDLYMNMAGWQALETQSGGTEIPLPKFNPDSINVNDLKSSSAGTMYFLPDNNKEFTKIIVEYMQLPVEVSAKYYTGGLANYILGMSSGNYLSRNLKAFDYIVDVKTTTYYRNKMECYAVIINVKTNKFADAYDNLLKALDNFKTFKPDKKYFNDVKTAYLYKDATRYETFSQKELYSNYLITSQQSNDIVKNRFANTKKLKASKISKFWASVYNTQNLRIIVVGDEVKIPNAIIGTGNKMQLINRSGTILN